MMSQRERREIEVLHLVEEKGTADELAPTLQP